MIMVMVMMHNVWYRRKAIIDEAFEISFNKSTILQEKITQCSYWFQNQNIESSLKVTEIHLNKLSISEIGQSEFNYNSGQCKINK